MEKKDCYYLGKITRTHGTAGQLQIFLDVDNARDYAKLDRVLVDMGKSLIPFMIPSVNIIRDNKAIVTIDGVKGYEQAEAMVGYDLYLPLSMLKPLKGNKFYYHEVIGFKVIDKEYGDIGEIKEIYEMNTDIFSIMKGNTEVLIPIIDKVIKKVDRENRTINIEAPEGVIALYLE